MDRYGGPEIALTMALHGGFYLATKMTVIEDSKLPLL
jgi:hypothetical protein